MQKLDQQLPSESFTTLICLLAADKVLQQLNQVPP